MSRDLGRAPSRALQSWPAWVLVLEKTITFQYIYHFSQACIGDTHKPKPTSLKERALSPSKLSAYSLSQTFRAQEIHRFLFTIVIALYLKCNHHQVIVDRFSGVLRPWFFPIWVSTLKFPVSLFTRFILHIWLFIVAYAW
jgi:hypothetical protein